MKELICIGCPNGCALTADETKDPIEVTGNACKKGIAFAIAELTHPTRSVCTTVRTAFEETPVAPVRTSKEIPKEKIFDAMREINETLLTERLAAGDAVIRGVAGTDADVIMTSDILKGGK